MSSLILRSLNAVAMCIAMGASAAFAQVPANVPAFVETLATKALLNELQSGGFVLYMRHGNTDNSKADGFPKIDLNDCSTQRPLSDQGREVVARVGKYFRQAKIPVSEVIHSPLCRARESAQLAFAYLSDKLRPEPNLMYPGNLTSEEKKPIIEMTRELVSTPVAPGTNRVLVAHAPNLADLMGYFVKLEATVVVLRPLGEGRFEYIASIHPSMWPELMK